MTTLFIHILFPDNLEANDIQVIRPPTADQPGQAQLQKAIVGDPRPEAPSSLPLISQSRATIGYVARTEFMDPPYGESYVIK